MNISIPLYIEQKQNPNSPPNYIVKPLFFEHSGFSDEKLPRAINKFIRSLTQTLEIVGEDFFQKELSELGFSPDIEDQFLRLNLDLGKRTVNANFLFVVFNSLNRRVVFTPSLPNFWFELPRGKNLNDQATSVLNQYFRQQEKKFGTEALKPEDISVEKKAWVSTIDLDFPLPKPKEKPSAESKTLATLGSCEEVDGTAELNKIGRCLNWLFPEDLERAIYREKELEELTKLLNLPEKKPILIIGPRMVGKTALVHEYVYQYVEKSKKSAYTFKKSLWLLSPQRLISGMSYVGQWEQRLLAILDTAKKNNLILYFDDLLGLFYAGVTSQSQLSVANVMKPILEKNEFQMLAEITPAAFRVLQERDRGFADLFHLLPVKETTPDQTLRILISAKRQLEHSNNCNFDLAVLPSVLNIQQRYVKDAVFPGKAAQFLKQLAVKYRNSNILRADVLKEFQSKSGLSLNFLDDNTKLAHKEITDALGKEIIGQPLALAAAADVITIAKAKLNDPDRPLAVFLFLGPTGVGKTQSAKAIAKYLFGDAERLIRFDMNEFITPDSLTRLVGTFYRPDGLLTSAIQRQPFSVLLLDEIEKADPDVFNLLLQVMGEGRLTDASGRTVDFTNVILIMTSNLGVKEANKQLGFQQSEANESAIYLQAVEKFFRPEFFNRIDRVVPFRKLSRADMSAIAKHIIQTIFSREGLLRRKCLLNIDSQAMEKIIDEGYNPIFGARALKRVIERQITQSVANQMMSLSNETPTIINIYPGKEKIVVHLEALTQISSIEQNIAKSELADPKLALQKLEAALAKLEKKVAEISPSGAFDASNLSPTLYHYFQIKGQLRRMEAICRNLSQRIAANNKTAIAKKPIKPNRKPTGYKETFLYRCVDYTGLWQQLFAAEDIHFALQEMMAQSSLISRSMTDQLSEAAQEFALLELMAETDPNNSQQIVLYIHPLANKITDSKVTPQNALAEAYLHLFNSKLGLESSLIEQNKIISAFDKVILVSNAHALPLVEKEVGTHLFLDSNGQLNPVSVQCFVIDGATDPLMPIKDYIKSYENWLKLFANEEKLASDNPAAILPVIRIYEKDNLVLDLKTGLVSDLRSSGESLVPTAKELHTFLLSAMKCPKIFKVDG